MDWSTLHETISLSPAYSGHDTEPLGTFPFAGQSCVGVQCERDRGLSWEAGVEGSKDYPLRENDGALRRGHCK